MFHNNIHLIPRPSPLPSIALNAFLWSETPFKHVLYQDRIYEMMIGAEFIAIHVYDCVLYVVSVRSRVQ